MVDDDTGIDNYNPIIEMRVADPEGTLWNQDYLQIKPNESEIDTDINNYRFNERRTLIGTTNDDFKFYITYSLKREAQIEAAINLARTVWVIIVLTVAAIHFGNSTNKLVLHPLERMLEIVKKIAKDPASAAAQDEMNNAGIYTFLNKNEKKDKNMETAILEQAI